MNCEICVIGSEAFLYPFLQFGFKTYSPTSPEALREYLQEVGSGYGIIYIEDPYCFHAKDIIERFWNSETPIIVPIGGHNEGESFSFLTGREMMEKAIGMHVV